MITVSERHNFENGDRRYFGQYTRGTRTIEFVCKRWRPEGEFTFESATVDGAGVFLTNAEMLVINDACDRFDQRCMP
ncbi:MAG TPA: hypothetical protein VMS04_11080 [Vicinamibacterales bacterium]|jgi:hypothetical protein|nr:hypothetical protein [Vicinamibacterales bacterium]